MVRPARVQFKMVKSLANVLAHAFTPSIWEVGGSLNLRLSLVYKASFRKDGGYTKKHCLKNQK